MKKIVIALILLSVFSYSISLVAYADGVDLDFHKVFEQHGSIMMIIDPETDAIVHVNKAAANFYGYEIEQLESMKINEINILTHEETEKEIRAAADEKRSYFVFKQRLASGDIRTVEVYAYPYADWNKTWLVSIIHDITAKTELEEKNRKMTNAFLFVLSGAVIFMAFAGLLLFKSYRKVKAQNHEINNFNELWRTFIDADDSLIYLKEENLKYVFVNKAFEDLYNRKASEIVSYDDFDLIDDELAVVHRKTDFDVIEKKAIVVDEVKWENRTFQTTKFPVKLLNDQYGIGAYAKDVTEAYNNKRILEKANEQLETINKELMEKQYTLEEQNAVIEELNSQLEEENFKQHQQKEILHAIIDSLGAGIMMTDTDGAILFINKAWKDIFRHLEFGYQFYPQDVFYINGVTLSSTERIIENMMIGIEDSNEILSRLKSLLTDNRSRYSVDMEQTNPVKRFINLYSNPCINQNNNSFGRVFVVRDVSHQKEVDRLKLELISTVSHELRTPMSSIMGFSELILTRELSAERNKEYIGIINSEAKRLTTLINDFLDIQKMESGKQVFNKQLTSIDHIIEEAVSLFQNFSIKHKVIYHKSAESIPLVYCDRDKLMQVLSNLLSNAIKYSPDGGEVKIVSEVGSNRVKIQVSDQGLGIPAYVEGKLFTKFYRIHNDDRREIGGTGLGLAICKEIVRAHGGEISFESIIGQGSTFSFYLPYSKSSTDNDSVKKAAGDLYTDNKDDVLIVEDDKSTVKLIKEVLKDEGLEMHAISSGEEALQLVAKNSYKLIILDIALSGQLDGWEVLKELKGNQETSNIPIIISSVYENKGVASQNDIADYLIKPFEPQEMVRMVQKALKGKLNSKMLVSNDDVLTEVILDMLNTRGLTVKQIDHSGNMLIITLEGEEGLKNE